MKAWESRRYYVYDGPSPPDRRISIPANWALEEMARWRAEDLAVAAAFDGYALYRQVEYADLFPEAGGRMSPGQLESLRAWFGVADAFTNRVALSKQSSLPLAETIENLTDVAAALAGTPFEYCLEDEPAYRQPTERL
jgi:hypothetical protein